VGDERIEGMENLGTFVGYCAELGVREEGMKNAEVCVAQLERK